MPHKANLRQAELEVEMQHSTACRHQAEDQIEQMRKQLGHAELKRKQLEADNISCRTSSEELRIHLDRARQKNVELEEKCKRAEKDSLSLLRHTFELVLSLAPKLHTTDNTNETTQDH